MEYPGDFHFLMVTISISQVFLVGDDESGECFQIHEMSNWNSSGALWDSIALCCVLQPILHDDSQSCCIFFSSLQTCSPFLPMHHKLSFAETLASIFAMYWVELFTPHLLYVLFWAKLQVSPLHYHMHPEHSPSHAEQQSSSQQWQHWITWPSIQTHNWVFCEQSTFC